MGDVILTTIAISEEVRDELEKLKLHPREPYEDVLQRILKRMNELKEEGTW